MRYSRLLLALVVLLIVAGGLGGHATAKHATFKQLILPIDCQFQVVANGLGTVVYLTPEACGQVPPPNNGGSGGQGNSGGGNHNSGGSNANDNGTVHIPSTPGSPASSRSIESDNPHVTPPITVGSRPKVTKLNTKPSAYGKSGYRAQLSLGSSLSYLPRSQTSGSLHTLTITNITATGITVLMQPSGQFVGIPLDRTIYLDFDNHGNPALEVHVLGVTTSGQAKVNVRLVNSRNADNVENAGLNPLLQVFIVVLIGFILISLSNYSWKRWLERKEDSQV